MPSPDLITIASERVRADIDPRRGGRLAQLAVDDVELLVPDGPDVPPTGWGCFPMVPWAGRIRRGRFTFDGTAYQLPINFEQHAIHGVGFTSAWTVTHHDDHVAELSLTLPIDESWPFGGTAAQRLEVDDDGIRMTLTVTAGDHAFPVSFGWHPWFRKPSALEFHPSAMYRRDDDHMTVDDLVAVQPPPWDDCFVNDEPVYATIDDVRLRLDSNCTTWVVYDERSYATCIEPETGPPDAFNIAPHRLDPGDSLSAWYRIEAA